MSFEIAGQSIPKGKRVRLEIPIASLFDYTTMSIPLEVIRGQTDGPVVFVSGAIHGDEIIGVEIIKRVSKRKELNKINGTIILIPIVNPFGYNNNVRYLPDRRDLNRTFPGSKEGSLAARIAYTFLHEIVAKCNYGIDIHSGSVHKDNFPQIRISEFDQESSDLAQVFGAPVVLKSGLRTGTLRKACHELGIKTLLYEAGEALRYDDHSINIGVHGILNVFKKLGMISKSSSEGRKPRTVIQVKSSYWIRARNSGSLRIMKKIGTFVKENELLGILTDPFGDNKVDVRASKAGIIIGCITMPLVNHGNALFHIATIEEMEVMGDGSIVFDSDIDIENEDWFLR
jgi:predicted deacylase